MHTDNVIQCAFSILGRFACATCRDTGSPRTAEPNIPLQLIRGPTRGYSTRQ